MLDLIFDRRPRDDADREFDLQVAAGHAESYAMVYRRGHILGRIRACKQRLIELATDRFGPPDGQQWIEFHVVSLKDVYVEVIRRRLLTASRYAELFHEWGGDVPL